MYKSFLQILHTVQSQNLPVAETLHRVEQLFIGHPDLIEEFKQFLPERSPEPTKVKDAGPAVQITPLFTGGTSQPASSLDNARQYVKKVKVSKNAVS